jgi:hypothetical protein
MGSSCRSPDLFPEFATMGKGIDMARGLDLETGGTGIHAAVLDDFKDQLCIVFLKQLKALGHDLHFPVAQVDDTGKDMVSFQIVDRVFIFELSKKS